jgi:hypothetical protein
MPLLFTPLIGRFGNLLFIFAHARAWAEQNGYELCLPPWVGEKIFTIPEAVRPDRYKPDLVWPENMRQNQESLIYTRKQVREWFTIRPELSRLMSSTRPDVVTLNVRRGDDYRSAGLVMISPESYVTAAVRAGYDPSDCILETDTNPTRHPYFTGNIDASGLGTTWVALPSFYRLMTAPVLFRANSTFSWWAATLGHGKVFSPIIRGLQGGTPNTQCEIFVAGNWPVMADNPPNSDLHLKEE